jgi:pimeloyl-ACP methyl ester carboxylesterase
VPNSTVTYKMRPRAASIESVGPTGGQRGSCVLLHGWDADGSSMKALCAALQALPQAAGWNFFTPTYETHTETFVVVANDLLPQLRLLPAPLILVVYSEGGVVARQMIADGLHVKSLVTICCPHLGIGTWLPTPDPGSASVSPFSPYLKTLNDSHTESAERHLYHCFGITCTDVLGDHPDDGVVPIQSALAATLGAVAERVTIHLDYNRHIAGWDPHLRGMDPNCLQPVLDTCANLFK